MGDYMKKKSNIGWWIAGLAGALLLKKKATAVSGIGATGIGGLSEGEFEELVQYVSDHVDHEWDRIGMKYIEERSPIPYQLEGQINDYAEEWCNDNDIDPDEYWDEYSAEDVFLHPKYDYDS